MTELKTRQSDTPENELITPKLIDWLLYDLPYLKERCEEIMPHDFTDIILFHPKTKTMVRSKIEIVACKRAILTQVLDAVERALKRQDKEHRAVYRMKYRAGMTIRCIAKRVFFNKDTVQKKVENLRNDVSLALQEIPASHIREFIRQNTYKEPDKIRTSYSDKVL